MKPVGLVDPRTGRTPYAVVQLRQDNARRRSLQPGRLPDAAQVGRAGARAADDSRARAAEFVRFGMVHRNTYINGPTVLPRRGRRGCAGSVLRRPDLRRRGLRRVGGLGADCRHERRGAGAGRRAARAAADAPPSARWRITCRTPTRRTTSPRTSRSASCRRPSRRRGSGAWGRPTGRRPRPCARCAHWTTGCAERPSRHDVAAPGPHRRAREHVLHTGAALMKAQIREFLEYLRLNRNASAHTVAAYDRRPDAVPDVHGRAARPPPRRPHPRRSRSHDDPAVPRRAARRDGHARASAARKLSALRAFGRYLRREGWIETDPAALAVSPRREQRIPAHLSVDEMSRACSRRPTPPHRSAGGIARSWSCSTRRGCASASSSASTSRT
jgi:hypothetical protein